jgi:hypothetical protein
MNLHLLMEAVENTISEDHHLTFNTLALHHHHPGLGPLKVSEVKDAHCINMMSACTYIFTGKVVH